ncbi:MAG: HAD family hydrolase [Spirochaetota bacterium]
MGVDQIKKAVFLDRDGIINQSVVRDGKPYPPASLQELLWVDDIAGCLQQIRNKGYLLVVFTNQPDVARGTKKQSDVEAIHAHMQEKLQLDAVYACFHDDVDECSCRKPKAGMLVQAAEDLSIDLQASYAVGDRWRDINAGKTAGCKTIFVDYGYAEILREKPDYVVEHPTMMLNYIK